MNEPEEKRLQRARSGAGWAGVVGTFQVITFDCRFDLQVEPEYLMEEDSDEIPNEVGMIKFLLKYGILALPASLIIKFHDQNMVSELHSDLNLVKLQQITDPVRLMGLSRS